MPISKSKMNFMEWLMKEYDGVSYTSEPMTITYHSWTLCVNETRCDFSMSRSVDNHGQPYYNWAHEPKILPVGCSAQDLYVACVQTIEKEFEDE